jgi:hypothetical protein
MAFFVERISGADRSTFTKGGVAGTDLGIPFVLENGTSIGYLFGDSFDQQQAGGPGWRSPVGFRSTVNPTTGIISFDSAYKTPASGGWAPELFHNAHTVNDFNPFGTEWTCIPNDGISFNATGDQLVSFMSINRWRTANGSNAVNPTWAGGWRTNFNAFAISHNGNDFARPAVDANYSAIWWNNEQNTDPFQMMTTADGYDGWVYCYSVRAGRQSTPMMLQKVPWDQMFNKAAYQGWNNNGGTWHWGASGECTPLLGANKIIGEPSVRRLGQGWAMSYLTDGGFFGGGWKIVTRKAPSPTGPWSAETTQVTQAQEPNLYGGFIHPWSDYGTNKLTIIVSKWVLNTPTYDSRQYRGTL